MSSPSFIPVLEVCPRAVSTTVSSPTACHSFTPTIQDDASISFRPNLKRQATAPATALANHVAKKLCEDDRMLGKAWSKDVHAAFLEALHHLPSNSTWPAKSLEEDSFDEKTGYCTIIQDHILRKTGYPQHVDDIHDRLHEAFNELRVSSPIDFPSSPIDTSQKRSDFMSQLLMNDLPGHIDDKILSELDARQLSLDSSSSMSRRRQACNRPTLKLNVKIPSAQTEYCGSSTPLTASFQPFKFPSMMDGTASPHTPVDKNMYIPIGPPDIPRIIDMQRATADRWMPTPTEGVFPKVLTSESPDIESSIISGNSDGTEFESNYPSVIEVPSKSKEQLRPKLGGRALSWLSVHKNGDICGFGALSSPFATPFPPTSPI